MAEMEPLEVARDYNEAYRARDVDRMLTLVDDACEFVSPRGVMRGHAAVRAFMERQSYGVTMVPTEQRYFARGDTVVVYGVVEWRYVDSGELAGREEGGIGFCIREGRIVGFTPYDDLATALSTTGLTAADENRSR